RDGCAGTASPPVWCSWMQVLPGSAVPLRQDDRGRQECLLIPQKVQRCQSVARRTHAAATRTASRGTLIWPPLWQRISAARLCENIEHGARQSGATPITGDLAVGEVANQRHAEAPSKTAPVGVASSAGMSAASAPDPGQPFLAADVGGTHARIGLVSGHADGRRPVSVLHYHRYGCADWASLTAMLQDFVAQLTHTPHAAAAAGIRDCAVACAGYVLDDEIVNGNLPWRVSISDIREGLGIQRLAVINDFEAVAYATQFIDAAETRPIIEAVQARSSGPKLVMGPGTGLGSAVLLPGHPRAQVLATEAGQISLAPGNEREIEILRVLGRDRPYVSVEDALSGPGLLKLYRALCELRGADPRWLTPAEVTAAAMAGQDPN